MSTPASKRIVILAKSIKRQHWCVAGKEVFCIKGKWSFGQWVRPVDPAHEGAITEGTMRCTDGQIPRFLDILDIPIIKWAGDPNHPEDWVVDSSRLWQRTGTLPFAELPKLVDRPPHLWKGWLDPRKVKQGFVSKMMRPATLYLIQPKNDAKAVIYWDEAKKRIKKRLYLRFQDQDHEFDITDPLFDSLYLGFHRSKGREPVEIPIATTGRLYLCLSLTPEFHGAHYKIAATIWEAPPP